MLWCNTHRRSFVISKPHVPAVACRWGMGCRMTMTSMKPHRIRCCPCICIQSVLLCLLRHGCVGPGGPCIPLMRRMPLLQNTGKPDARARFAARMHHARLARLMCLAVSAPRQPEWKRCTVPRRQYTFSSGEAPKTHMYLTVARVPLLKPDGCQAHAAFNRGIHCDMVLHCTVCV